MTFQRATNLWEMIMAWEISISVAGWEDIREKLEKWSRRMLLNAICDDKFEKVLEYGDLQDAERAAVAERKRLENLPHDWLVDRAFALIEQNNICENGGYGYWIDREGCHVVWL
jgi:hypothetical protein